MIRRLNNKQARFVEELTIDWNQAQAAIRAGYSPATARTIASELMQMPHIKAEVDRVRAELSRRTGVTAERLIDELAKIAFVNATDVLDMDDATVQGGANREDTAAIASVKVKRIPTQDGAIEEREVKLHDKIRAIELLGKNLGLFKDAVNLSGEVGIRIVDDVDAG